MMSFTNSYRYLFVFHNWYAQRIYKDPVLGEHQKHRYHLRDTLLLLVNRSDRQWQPA
jgi:hypothetical protein